MQVKSERSNSPRRNSSCLYRPFSVNRPTEKISLARKTSVATALQALSTYIEKYAWRFLSENSFRFSSIKARTFSLVQPSTLVSRAIHIPSHPLTRFSLCQTPSSLCRISLGHVFVGHLKCRRVTSVNPASIMIDFNSLTSWYGRPYSVDACCSNRAVLETECSGRKVPSSDNGVISTSTNSSHPPGLRLLETKLGMVASKTQLTYS